MEYFVRPGSIVRKIWGSGDTVLFIFAGASAEFALNKAVDWLYFTGRLPADPLNRLFSTVNYARLIVFSEKRAALEVIDRIYSIHKSVEDKRESSIPDWAYRDVLFMLIHYSIASFEVLQRQLSELEKQEVYDVFFRVGDRMKLKELPRNYSAWLESRARHMRDDLEKTPYTSDLFLQYKKHLGSFRFRVLIEAQKLVVPEIVSNLLGFKRTKFFLLIIPVYKLSRMLKLDWFLVSLILPREYKSQVKELNRER